MGEDRNGKIIETPSMQERPIRLFPDSPRLESITEDEGIFFHVPISPSACLSPVASSAQIGSPSTSSMLSFSTIVIAETPVPSVMKRADRLCFDDVAVECERDRVERQLAKAQMRLKCLKSMKRHTRRRDSITLREEEEEDVVDEVTPDANEEVKQNEANEETEEMKPHWIETKAATSSFVSFASFLYALMATVYLAVEETTYEEPEDGSIFPPGTAFHYYMYAVGIGFMVYVNLFIIHPPWFNRLLYYLADRGWWRNAEKYVIMPAAHNGHPVSSLYLRLGTALFGCGGVVLFGLELFLLFSHKSNTRHASSSSAENILGAVFTFLQMYFMNVNYKLSIDSSPNVCRFGFMHNFSLNLWIWHRYSTAKQHEHAGKQAIKERDEREALRMDDQEYSGGSFNDYGDLLTNFTSSESSSEVVQQVFSPTTTPLMLVSNHYVDRLVQGPHVGRGNNTSTEEYQNIIAVLEYFGDFAGFLDTCLIEYSVIGATIMFVFWRNLDAPTKSSERKQSFRMDFTNTFTGFHLGVVIFVLGAVVCGVYSALVNDKNPDAYLLLGIYESLCYSCCILAVAISVILMRSLVLAENGHSEDVDRILLYIAFVGELLWCSADLSRFIDGEAGSQGGFIFAVTLLRFSHVFLQTWFILMASKLELSPSTNVSAMRGRQCVTFLIVVNLTLFFFNIYTSMTDGFGYVSPLTSNHAYIKLLSEPLITFYRFHSTVCLAEVWKRSFSRPKARHSQTSISQQSSLSPA